MDAPAAVEVAGPARTCVGCGAKMAKRELVRLVADAGGKVQVDEDRRAPGRGVYVCGAACARRAAAKRSFARSLRRKVEAGEELAEKVEAAVARLAPPGSGGKAGG
jgi:predicted RNA-binding protein YlxR (DUF448 family)